jgi:hypothetical protein
VTVVVVVRAPRASPKRKTNLRERDSSSSSSSRESEFPKDKKTPISKNKNTRKEIIAHLEFYFVLLGSVFLLLDCLPACLELQFLDLLVEQGRTVDAFSQSVSSSVGC